MMRLFLSTIHMHFILCNADDCINNILADSFGLLTEWLDV
jgi:hypothetical protein